VIHLGTSAQRSLLKISVSALLRSAAPGYFDYGVAFTPISLNMTSSGDMDAMSPRFLSVGILFHLRIYQSPDLRPIRVSPLEEYRTIRIGRFPQRPHPACIGKHQSLRPCVRQPRNQARTGLKNLLSPEVCDGTASRTESSTERT
jgi:hypothetical protein